MLQTLLALPHELMLTAIVLVPASAGFMVWFARLDPDQRRDVIRLVRALRRR